MPAFWGLLRSEERLTATMFGGPTSWFADLEGERGGKLSLAGPAGEAELEGDAICLSGVSVEDG